MNTIVSEELNQMRKNKVTRDVNRMIGWLTSEVVRQKRGIQPTPKQNMLAMRLKAMLGVETLPELESVLEDKREELRSIVDHRRFLRAKEKILWQQNHHCHDSLSQLEPDGRDQQMEVDTTKQAEVM